MKSRFLIVDDDGSFCELLSLYFSAKGFEVVAARTAAEATTLLQESEFDLIILDWYLDGADALDLLNLCKQRYPAVPVIIFTGAEVEAFLKAALAGRAEAVVRKMGSLEALSKQVCKYLQKKELVSSNHLTATELSVKPVP